MSTPATVKSGSLFIDSVDVPEGAVKPGGSVRVHVNVRNNSFATLAMDPDTCDAPAGPSQGYYTRAVADPAWTTSQSNETCVGNGGVGVGTWTQEFTFTAPSTTGFHQIEFWLAVPNSGDQSQKITRSVEVDEDGSADPDPGDDNDGNGGNGDDPDDTNILCEEFGIMCGDGDGPLAELGETAKWAVILIVTLVALFALGNLFDINVGDDS